MEIVQENFNSFISGTLNGGGMNDFLALFEAPQLESKLGELIFAALEFNGLGANEGSMPNLHEK